MQTSDPFLRVGLITSSPQDTSRSYLVTSDFYPAFPTQKEAEAAFAVFDKDGNGDISRPEIRHTILAAYKERRFLARSLQDVSEAVSTLDRLFQVAAWIVGLARSLRTGRADDTTLDHCIDRLLDLRCECASDLMRTLT